MALVSPNRKPGIHIAWKTVTYRSVALLVFAVMLAFFVAVRFAFPQFTESTLKAANGLGTRLLEVVAGAGTPAKSGTTGARRQGSLGSRYEWAICYESERWRAIRG